MGKIGRGGKPFRALLTGAVGAAVAILLWTAGALDRWELRSWDGRVLLMARAGPATDRVRLVLLDQESLDWGVRENGLSWPWPREVYVPILRYLKRSGASTAAFDLLYTEPSGYGVEDDRIFGEAIREYGAFVGTLFLGTSAGTATAWPRFVPPPALSVKGLPDWAAAERPRALDSPRALFPVPEVAIPATRLGNVQSVPDPDGVYRRIRLFQTFDGRVVPSLALAAYLVARPGTELSIRPGTLVVGDTRVPIDRDGYAILRFRGPSGAHRAYGAASVIQSELRVAAGEPGTIRDADAFRDRHVFFGASAPGLLDLRPVPISSVYAAVALHATALDNLLAGDFLSPVPPFAAVLLILLAGLVGGALATFARTTGWTVLSLAFVLSAPPALSLAAYAAGYWLPLVGPEIAAALAFVAGVIANFATEGKQKRFIKSAFRQYLSPAVIDQLLADPGRLKLGGERRTLSIFFSDLQGFTGISEGLDPETLTALLNEYLSAMTDIIQDEGGTVDKYEGDAIIAFWNAPLEQQDHAERAVRAALRCQERLSAMRPALKSRIGKDLYMRIGVNTGPVVVGNMGSANRFDYTIIGDAANLASRLEGVNKQFGTYTLVSEATRDLLGPSFFCREVARVAVVGRKEPVRVFEPMRPESLPASKGKLTSFAAGLSAFQAGRFDEALAAFREVADGDPAAAAYIIQCEELIAAPPDRWDGVWIMTAKG